VSSQQEGRLAAHKRIRAVEDPRFIRNLSYSSRGQTTKVSCNGKGEKEKAERSYVEISRCSSVDLTGINSNQKCSFLPFYRKFSQKVSSASIKNNQTNFHQFS
jgi:hypothetical protein